MFTELTTLYNSINKNTNTGVWMYCMKNYYKNKNKCKTTTVKVLRSNVLTQHISPPTFPLHTHDNCAHHTLHLCSPTLLHDTCVLHDTHPLITLHLYSHPPFHSIYRLIYYNTMLYIVNYYNV